MVQIYNINKKPLIVLFLLSLVVAIFSLPFIYLGVNMQLENYYDFSMMSFVFIQDYNIYLDRSIFIFLFMYSGLLTIIIPLCTLNFLHNKSSADFCYALPIKKTKLFVSSFVLGAIVTFVPIIVSKVIFIVIHISFGLVYTDVGTILYIFITGILMLLVVYTINSLSCVLSKTSIEAFILMVTFNVGIFFMFFVALGLANNLLFGFFTGVSLIRGNIQGSFVHYLSPAFISGAAYFDIVNVNQFNIAVVLWVIIGILAFIMSYIIIDKYHKTEDIGKGSYSGFSAILIKITSTLSIGFLFANFGMSYFAFLTSSLLTFYISHIVISRSVRFLKFLTAYAVIAVCGLIFIIFLNTGGLGYSTRMPQRDEVTSVSFPNLFISNHPDNFITWGGDLREDIDYQTLRFYDQQLIDLVFKLHKSIINVDGSLNQSNPNLYNFWNFTTLQYNLSDGSTFTRHFNVQPIVAREIVLQIFSNPNYMHKFGSPFNIDTERILIISYSTGLGSSNNMHLTNQQIVSLVNTMQDDLLLQTPQQLLNPRQSSLGTIQFMAGNTWHHVQVMPWWYNTIELLYNFGYQFYYTNIADTAIILDRQKLMYAGLIWETGHSNFFEEVKFAIWHSNFFEFDVHTFGTTIYDQEQVNYLWENSVHRIYTLLANEYDYVLFLQNGIPILNMIYVID